MSVECAAVDHGAFGDILDGDWLKTLFPDELKKCLPDIVSSAFNPQVHMYIVFQQVILLCCISNKIFLINACYATGL